MLCCQINVAPDCGKFDVSEGRKANGISSGHPVIKTLSCLFASLPCVALCQGPPSPRAPRRRAIPSEFGCRNKKRAGRSSRATAPWEQRPHMTQETIKSTTQSGGQTHCHRGHSNLAAALKGPSVTLGLCKCNYPVTAKRELSAASG